MSATDLLLNSPGRDLPGARFWYVIIQISRDLIPAVYENEKNNFPRLTRLTRLILTILICK